MTRTVGIFTHHEAYNFGAALQAYALRRTIAGMGHSCSIVDCREPAVTRPLLRIPRDRASLKHDVLMLINLPSHLRSRRRFGRFRAENLSLTARPFWSPEELQGSDVGFDTYVSGSDQVWHPSLLDRVLGQFFFQTFETSARRVAYAPSFGLAEIPTTYRDRIRPLIGRFDFLSAREDTGCAIIEELTGRAAAQVLDPTLLVPAGHYDEIAVEPAMAGPYILLYPMQWSEPLRELALKARSRLRLPIVAVLPPMFEPWRFSFADRRVYDAGPAEFLGWVKRAAFVCTNSFHGTAFSVIYRKDFLSVLHSTTGSRQRSLLRCLGLLPRLLEESRSRVDDDAVRRPLDYEPVEPRLAGAVETSVAFLRRALA